MYSQNKKRRIDWQDRALNALVAVIVLAIVSLFLVGVPVFKCSWTWAGTDIESRYHALGGCQVKANGRWIPSSKFRAVDE